MDVFHPPPCQHCAPRIYAPVIEYGSLAMSAMNAQQQDALERLQRRSAKRCLRLSLFSPCHHSSLLHQVTWPTLLSRWKLKQLLFAHAIAVKRSPPQIQLATSGYITEPPSRELRGHRVFALPTTHSTRLQRSPLYSACTQYNHLPPHCYSLREINAFRREVTPIIVSSICTCSNPRCSPA